MIDEKSIAPFKKEPSGAEERPLITFALFAYNQEKYIREAVEGAFSQTYSPLEIILSDDCSSDQTFEIIREMAEKYTGPHTIILNRNEPNRGLIPHVNKICGELACGEIIVMAGGDDIALPDRVKRSEEILTGNPEALAVSFSCQIMDSDGKYIKQRQVANKPIEYYSLNDYLKSGRAIYSGASRSIRKHVYEYFGPLSKDAVTEDSTMFFRSLLLGPICYSSSIMVNYRIHGNNMSAAGNRCTIDYAAIHSQYIKDIDIAVKGGLVGQKDADQLKDHLEQQLRKNQIVSEFYTDKSKVKSFVRNIICSPLFTIRDKSYYFVKSIRPVGLSKRK